MVCFCSWGRGSERFNDIVDEVIVGDDLTKQEFSGPSTSDVVMTTWHDDETLEETLDFLATCAVPIDGFTPDSHFRLVISVANQQWALKHRNSSNPRSFSLEPPNYAGALIGRKPNRSSTIENHII